MTFAKELQIAPHSRSLGSTNIAILVPLGTYGCIAPRTGLSVKNSIDIGAGVIDADYCGPVKILLINHANTPFHVKEGDRVAHLVLEYVQTPDIATVDALPETEQGEQGFGSTGIASVNQVILERRVMFIRVRSVASNQFADRIIKAGALDKQWTSYKIALESGRLIDNPTFQDALVCYKNRIFIPDCKDLKLTVTRQAHDTKVAGHFGRDKTLELLTRNYHWPNLDEWVKTYVKTCDACQRNQTVRHKKYGLLQPLDIPYRPWEHISIDFITDLPKVNGYDQIWVIVDRFTKMAYFIPLHNRLAHNLALAFIREVWRLHGLPVGVVSDRDMVFTSKLWSEIMRLLDISQDMSTAYHLQTDGQTETVNQALDQYLRPYCSWDQKNWMELLPYAEFCYNNTVNSSTKMTPLQACGILPHSCIVISLPLPLVITYSVIQGNLSLSYR